MQIFHRSSTKVIINLALIERRKKKYNDCLLNAKIKINNNNKKPLPLKKGKKKPFILRCIVFVCFVLFLTIFSFFSPLEWSLKSGKENIPKQIKHGLFSSKEGQGHGSRGIKKYEGNIRACSRVSLERKIWVNWSLELTKGL